MVPVAVPSWMVAPVAVLRVTVKVSVCSSTVSSTVGTGIVFEASPGANWRVPEVCGVVGALLGGPVCGGVVDGDGLGAGPAQGDGDDWVTLALLDGVVADVEQGECGDGPVVVGDGAGGGSVLDGGAAGLLRVTVKVSVCSSMSSFTVGTEIVLELSLVAKVSGGVRVVRALTGGPGGGGVVDGDAPGAGPGQGDGEHDRVTLARLGVRD